MSHHLTTRTVPCSEGTKRPPIGHVTRKGYVLSHYGKPYYNRRRKRDEQKLYYVRTDGLTTEELVRIHLAEEGQDDGCAAQSLQDDVLDGDIYIRPSYC